MNSYEAVIAAKYLNQAEALESDGRNEDAMRILESFLLDYPGDEVAITHHQRLVFKTHFKEINGQTFPNEQILETIRHLAADNQYYKLLPLVASQPRELLSRIFNNDPLLKNFIVNSWEFATGQLYLNSHPWNVGIPIAETCNAKCLFCSSYNVKNAWLDVNRLHTFKDALVNAKNVGLIGYGEPLAHPQFPELLAGVREYTDRRCSIYTITNGLLLERYKDLLLNADFGGYCVSLNAATSRTHNQLMGMGEGAFDKIVTALRYIKDTNPSASIQLSLVVTSQNISEIPAFIRLAESLGAETVYIRTLHYRETIPSGSCYHLLPPYLHPEYDKHKSLAEDAIAKARVPVQAVPDSWGIAVFPAELDRDLRLTVKNVDYVRPELRTHYLERPSASSMTKGRLISPPAADCFTGENPCGRTPPLRCSYPYINFNISNLDGMLTPCCYMHPVPGYEEMYFDGSNSFFEIWNSPAYVALRRHLFDGPLHNSCYTCMSDSVMMGL